VPRKQPTPKEATPQFDADPLDDEDQPPFTMDDDGNVVLRRSAPKPKPKGKPRGKGKDKPAR
jgi:hypothetical protein